MKKKRGEMITVLEGDESERKRGGKTNVKNLESSYKDAGGVEGATTFVKYPKKQCCGRGQGFESWGRDEGRRKVLGRLVGCFFFLHQKAQSNWCQTIESRAPQKKGVFCGM